LTSSCKKVSLTETGDAKTIKFTANVDWTATASETWLTVEPVSGTKDKCEFSVKAAALTNPGSREGTVIITGGSASDTVYLTQGCDESCSVSPNKLEFTFDDTSEKEFKVKSNVAWKIESKAGWVHVNPSSGEASETEQVVKVKVDGNPDETDRTAPITVIGQSKNVTVTVLQTAEQREPLAFWSTEKSAFDIKFDNSSNLSLSYMISSKGKWTQYSDNMMIQAGNTDTVFFRADNDNASITSGAEIACQFSSNDGTALAVKGDLMSLFSRHKKKNQETLGPGEFFSLFGQFGKLIDASGLILPDKNLSKHCFKNLFGGCVSLKAAPELRAMELADSCYAEMFNGCKSLSTSPALPATQLAKGCYFAMFAGCTDLTKAPDLPAGTLVEGCYRYIFAGCSNIDTVNCHFSSLGATSIENALSEWLTGAGTEKKDKTVNLRKELNKEVVSEVEKFSHGWTCKQTL